MDRHRLALTLARTGVVGLAGALVALTGWAIAARAGYPYELEWMEGATVVHVARLAAGQPLYAAPSLEFIPFGYPPLYYLASLPLTWVLGAGYTPLRLVSILSTGVTLLAVFQLVRRESGRTAGFVAAGAFAGTYPLSDGWLDLGRVDALFVALLAVTWSLAAGARTTGHWVAAGAAAGAAFLTKQPAIVAIVPLVLYLLVTDRRAALRVGGGFAVVAGIAFLLFDWWTGGWYRYYVFDLPRMRLGVSSRGERLLSFWTEDLMGPLGLALALGLGFAIHARLRRHMAVAVGLIVCAWLARMEGGSWTNAVMPAHLAAAALLGLALRPAGRWHGARLAAAAAQLAVLLFDPRALIPTARDRQEAGAFVDALRRMEAPVLVQDHGFWATQAGLPEHAHGWAITDVVWADKTRTGRALESAVADAIRRGQFGTIVVDGEPSWFRAEFQRAYSERGTVRMPRPVSGAPRHARYRFMK